MKTFVEPIKLIVEERLRQKENENFSQGHDDTHKDGSLAMAAALYASPKDDLMRVIKCEHCNTHGTQIDPWPWRKKTEPSRGIYSPEIHAWDKRNTFTRMRRLQVAGALILAEMERLQRLEKTTELILQKKNKKGKE